MLRDQVLGTVDFAIFITISPQTALFLLTSRSSGASVIQSTAAWSTTPPAGAAYPRSEFEQIKKSGFTEIASQWSLYYYHNDTEEVLAHSGLAVPGGISADEGRHRRGEARAPRGCKPRRGRRPADQWPRPRPGWSPRSGRAPGRRRPRRRCGNGDNPPPALNPRRVIPLAAQALPSLAYARLRNFPKPGCLAVTLLWGLALSAGTRFPREEAFPH